MPDFLNLPVAFLALVPAIIGLTAAVKSEFPSLKDRGSIVAAIVTVIIYFAYLYLPVNLFGLLYAVGSSMGVYTTVKTAGTVKLEGTNQE